MRRISVTDDMIERVKYSNNRGRRQCVWCTAKHKKTSSSSVINEEEESFDATVGDRQSASVAVDDGQSTKATVEDGQSDLSMRPPTVRRRKNPIELVAAGETVKDASVTLKETIKKRQIYDDDECDLHGKVIANKLKKITRARKNAICL